MKQKPYLLRAFARGIVAAGLGWTLSAQADLLVNFPFNEGSGTNVADTAQGLQEGVPKVLL